MGLGGIMYETELASNKMKTKIFLYHLTVFIGGSVGIAFYLSQKFSRTGLAIIALFPVMLVFIAGFGLLCVLSLLIFLFVSYIRNKRKA